MIIDNLTCVGFTLSETSISLKCIQFILALKKYPCQKRCALETTDNSRDLNPNPNHDTNPKFNYNHNPNPPSADCI